MSGISAALFFVFHIGVLVVMTAACYGSRMSTLSEIEAGLPMLSAEELARVEVTVHRLQREGRALLHRESADARFDGRPWPKTVCAVSICYSAPSATMHKSTSISRRASPRASSVPSAQRPFGVRWQPKGDTAFGLRRLRPHFDTTSAASVSPGSPEKPCLPLVATALHESPAAFGRPASAPLASRFSLRVICVRL